MMAKIEPEEQVDCVNEEPDAEEGNVAGGLKDGGVEDDEASTRNRMPRKAMK